MMISLGLVGGLILLILSGDALVKGAVSLAVQMGIPAIVVSLTVVAFGTSAPELVISLQAALSGASDIAVGNVVGSNIANVLLVLGIPALLSPFRPAGAGLRQSYGIMLAATALLVVLTFGGQVSRVGGLILVAGLALMLTHSVHHARKGAADDGEGTRPISPRATGLFLVAGLIGLPLGAHLFVEASVDLARRFDISEAVIGLTLVAIGTSLPELATSVMAARRGRADVAMGNVVGSNIFNILGILGITAVVAPLPVPPQILVRDLWVMVGAALLLAPMIHGGMRLTRGVGAALCAGYAAYAVVLLQ